MISKPTHAPFQDTDFQHHALFVCMLLVFVNIANDRDAQDLAHMEQQEMVEFVPRAVHEHEFARVQLQLVTVKGTVTS